MTKQASLSEWRALAGFLDELLMTKWCVFASAMLVFQLPGCSVFTEPGPERFTAVLKVDNAPSPVTNAANASGDALFSKRRALLDFAINVSGLSSNATAAHIHGPAAPGAVGEILVSFFVVPGTTDARVAGGVVSATSSPGVSLDSVFVLMRNGSAYVDVHTELNPNGEIFGQIERGFPISTEP